MSVILESIFRLKITEKLFRIYFDFLQLVKLCYIEKNVILLFVQLFIALN